MNRYFPIAAALLATAPIAMPAPAASAPQVLGLVASNGPVYLKCVEGTCAAEFSTFCLQADRKAPAPGTAYSLVGEGTVHVVARLGDNSETVLDAAKDLSFAVSRGHVAMRVALDPATVKRLNPIEVAVSIDRNVALRPATIAGDENPQSEQELSLAAGPLRQLATRHVDGNIDRMSAARLTSRMINLLPPSGPFSREARAQVWTRAVSAAGPLTPKAERFARNGFDLCDFTIEAGSNSSMRRCLEAQHDSLLKSLNSGYWKAVGAGS